MKKVIQIRKDPSFNIAVKSYLLDLNAKGEMSCGPYPDRAIYFSEKPEEEINLSLYRVKQSFSRAIVKLIEIE